MVSTLPDGRILRVASDNEFDHIAAILHDDDLVRRIDEGATLSVDHTVSPIKVRLVNKNKTVKTIGRIYPDLTEFEILNRRRPKRIRPYRRKSVDIPLHKRNVDEDRRI